MNNNFFNRLFVIIFGLIILNFGIAPFVSSSSIKSDLDFEKNIAPLNIDWWPMFHHDVNKNGFSTSSAPDSDEVLWSYEANHVIISSPAVSNGKMFIGSTDYKLYCFDMMNGSVLWNFTTNGKITSSPAVYEDKVYIGSRDSSFYCLNEANGNLIWDYETNFMIESSPTLKNDKVFFGNSGGSLFCLDATNGDLIWEYSAGNVIWSSPAVTESKVYFGTHSGEFYCLDLTNGGLIWSNTTTSGIWTSPSVYDEKVYFGSNNNYVYCFDEDGDFIWSFDTGGEVHSSPAIAYGNVYIGSTERGLFCINAETGDLVWKYLISNGVWSPPSVADGKVYYGTDPCCGAPAYFHCSDAFTGDHIWKYNTGGEVALKSSPAIAAGIVFIGTGNGLIIAFGGDDLYCDTNGPYTGMEDAAIQFKGSAYGGRPDYNWHWEFGDAHSSDEQNPMHIFTDPGNYTVKLTVTDKDGKISNDTTWTYVENINTPPGKPAISGPKNGKPGASFDYIFNAVDLDGDDVKYHIDWGDCSFDNTTFVTSGTDIIMSHSWSTEGIFTIKAQSEDINGDKSDWAEYTVTMPRDKTINTYLLKFLQNHPNLKNLILLILYC